MRHLVSFRVLAQTASIDSRKSIVEDGSIIVAGVVSSSELTALSSRCSGGEASNGEGSSDFL